MLPTPPASHRSSRRRRLNSSDESAASSGSGSSVVNDKISNYRVGQPAPLRALPLTTVEVPNYAPYKRIQEQVHQSLQKLGITYTFAHLVQRYEPGMSPTDEDYTILIEADQHDQWEAALETISGLLPQPTNVRIEIISPLAHVDFFPPRLDQEFKEAWDTSLRAQIIKALGSGAEWQSLTVLNRGRSREESCPTVTVAITPLVNDDWQSDIDSTIYQLLESWTNPRVHPKADSSVPFVDPNVAFVRASHTHRFREAPPPIELPASAFGGAVVMGSSIGVRKSSGTLAGFVHVRFKGTEYTMGLTNHHVIQDESMTPEEKANGYAPDLARACTVDAPSSLDREASLECFQDRLDEVQKDIENTTRGREFSNLAPGLAYQVQQRQDMVRNYKESIGTTKQSNLRFGSVFASSGNGRYYRADQATPPTQTGNATDWALIYIPEVNRIGNNVIPEEKRWKDYNFAQPGPEVISAAQDDIRPETRLFKKGRMGASVGEVSHYAVDINLEGIIFRAAVVMPQRTKATKGMTDFLYAGDSGSFCLDSSGTFCALGFAGNEESGAGYVMPTSWVYNDIIQKTGVEIIDPILS